MQTAPLSSFSMDFGGDFGGKKEQILRSKNLPMRGIDSEVSGIFSAMASINTENAKRTVTPAKKSLKS